jgi:hypothetical protein
MVLWDMLCIYYICKKIDKLIVRQVHLKVIIYYFQMSVDTHAQISIVNCTKQVWEQFCSCVNIWTIELVETDSCNVLFGIKEEVPVGCHLLTLVTVNVGHNHAPFLVTLRFSNLLPIPEFSQTIGSELCRRAAVSGNLKLLKSLRKRGWEWDWYTMIDGSEECAKWAHENGCPTPEGVIFQVLRQRRNLGW